MTATKTQHTIDLTGESHVDVGTCTSQGRIVGYLDIGPFRLLLELPVMEDLQRRVNETIDDHADREEGYDDVPFGEE